MARKASIDQCSQWLPGFEPDSGHTPPVRSATDLVSRQLQAVEWASAQIAAKVVTRATEAPTPTRRLSIVAAIPAAPRLRSPRLRRADLEGLGGAVTKFEANVKAIECLDRIETEHRHATAAERLVLARYTGWGSLPGAFNLDGTDPAWVDRARHLQGLLREGDYTSARASVNNSHYTPLHVIEALWSAVQRLGFTGGRVLEPAAGIGHFIGAMPEELAAHSQVTAVEIDQLSGRMLQSLYAPGGANVHIAPFEKSEFPSDWFDLVIGNVPFGAYKVPDTTNRPYAAFSIHNYFIARSLDLLRPGGLIALITSSHTLEAAKPAARRYIASQAHLLGAIRLPQGAFAEMADTGVRGLLVFSAISDGTKS